MINQFKSIIITILSLGIIPLNSQNLEWARQMSGPDTDAGHSIAIDASGNVYTTGKFSAQVDFDPNEGTYILSGAGSFNFFIQKLDPEGNLIWAKQTGGSSTNEGEAIAVDAEGNVYTTGYFEGTIDFDPNSNEFIVNSEGERDIFIQKLDSEGNLLWAKHMGGTLSESGKSIVLDEDGKVYITGWFNGTVDFDPNSGIFNLTSLGSWDIFIQKLDNDGNLIWVKQMGGAFLDSGYSIDIDSSGNVYTIGTFIGSSDFDPGVGEFNLSSSGNSDIFIQKLNANGDFVWAKQMGGANIDIGNSIAIDASGNVYSTGLFSATADFAPNEGSYNLTSTGQSDIYIQKLNSNGTLIWVKQLQGTNSASGNCIKIDNSGNIFITGIFEGTVDFDPNSGATILTSAIEDDIFIQKIDTSGNFFWVTKISGSAQTGGRDVGNSIAVDNYGNIYSTGSFTHTADFDPTEGVLNLTGAGFDAIYIQKLSDSDITAIDKDFDSYYSVFPNPTSGHLYISKSDNFLTGSYVVRNILGQEINRGVFDSVKLLDLNVDGSRGVYFLEITEGNYKTVLKIAKN